MNLSDNLKKLRKDNNLSQEQFAEKLGVSRQAVSKWESGLSYPEMDKVLQICQLFDLNVNELINENLKEVNEIKEAQVRTNKYINSFFDYITKVVDMFSSMKWKERIKCLFEQLVVLLILFILFIIIGSIGSAIISSILLILPDTIYYPIYKIFETLYCLITIIVGLAILLHVFKIRYLDYYEIVKEDRNIMQEEISNYEEKKNELVENKIILEKKKEKVIIRDPKHSEYKFFTGIGKIILFFIKIVLCFFLLVFSCSMIVFVVCIPISFLVFNNSLLFWGLLISLFGAVLLNGIVLEIIYNFIVNNKFNKTKIFIFSIISLIMLGLGIGFGCVSITQFKVEEKKYDLVESSFIFDMSDNLVLNSLNYYDSSVEYIEKDIDNVEIFIKHSDVYDLDFLEYGNVVEFNSFINENSIFKYVNKVIDDLNKKSINVYNEEFEIVVYANKANILKIQENCREYDVKVEEYENRISELEEELVINRSNYENVYDEKERLEYIIENSGYQVIYDNQGNIISIENWNQ